MQGNGERAVERALGQAGWAGADLKTAEKRNLGIEV